MSRLALLVAAALVAYALLFLGPVDFAAGAWP